MSARTVAIVLIVATALARVGAAQSSSSVQVAAEAEPMQVRVGETVTLTVQVQGASSTVVRTPELPTLTGVAPVRQAPARHRTLSSGSQGLEQTITFAWQLNAEREGTARIGPVSVRVQGEPYTTAPIRIQVGSESGRSAPNDRTRLDRSSPASGLGDTALDSESLFIRASVQQRRLFQNEQAVVTYRLFYRPGVRLRHSRLADAWSSPGFWREEFEVASRPIPQTRRVGGQTYETIVLKRVALFPMRPGTFRVDPLRIEAEAQGVMEMQGARVRGRFEPVQLASEALSFEARPLPPSAPPSFDGAVGQFRMGVEVGTDSTKVGAPVEVTVQIRGSGNLATLSPPSLDAPSAFEMYDPLVQTNIDRGGQRIRGRKTFTYTLVPRSGGRYSLGPVTFAYFDPDRRRYETLQTAPPTLHVSGAAAVQTVGRTGEGLPVGDVTSLMEAGEAAWVRTDRRPLYLQLWVYGALAVPLLLALGGALWRRRAAEADLREAPERDAAFEAARDRLQEARRRLHDGSGAVGYDAVEHALLAFVDERVGRSGAGTPRTALDRHLARHDVPEDLRTALANLLDRCEAAQFAPNRPPPDSMETVLDEAQTVLQRLDSHLPRTDESGVQAETTGS